MRNTPAQPSTSPKTAAPPRRRWRRVLLAFGLLGALAFGGYWVLRVLAANDLAAALAETDRLDPGWRFADIEAARPQPDPTENSALHLAKVLALAGRNSILHRNEHADLFDNLEPPYELHAVQLKLLQEAYENLDEARQEARRLKDMPKGRHPLKFAPDFVNTMLTSQQNTRRISEILQHDVWLRAHGGDADGALESCRAGLNAARSLGDEPFLISVLIRLACDQTAILALQRTLAQSKNTSDAALKEVQELIALEIVDAQAHWFNALRGERGGQEMMVRAINEGKIKPSLFISGWGNNQPGVLEQLADYFPGAITRDYPLMLRTMNEAVEIGKQPLEEHREQMRTWRQKLPVNSILCRTLLPALENVTQAHLRNQALFRSALVAVAAERFRLREMRWPESTAELEKAGLLAKTPTDPFDGAALRWRPWTDGRVAYSVGLDKADNGGTFDPRRPFDPGMDLGFRLWNVDRRRQPARHPRMVDDDDRPR